MRALPLGLISAVVVSVLSGTAWAGSACPADLTAVQGQISTPSLQPVLNKTIDQIIAQAGGIDQAISNAQAERSALVVQRNALLAQTPPANTRTIDEALMLEDAGLSALQCRKAQN